MIDLINLSIVRQISIIFASTYSISSLSFFFVSFIEKRDRTKWARHCLLSILPFLLIYNNSFLYIISFLFIALVIGITIFGICSVFYWAFKPTFLYLKSIKLPSIKLPNWYSLYYKIRRKIKAGKLPSNFNLQNGPYK